MKQVHPLPRRPRRHLARGLTLIEIMVVVVIMGLIAGAVAFAVITHLKEARLRMAETQAIDLRRAAQGWMMMHGAECPTSAVLARDGVIDEASKLTDPWGLSYDIVCEGERVTVRSSGPDKKKDTDDDIVVPRRAPDPT